MDEPRTDDEGWSEVVRRWDDAAAHEAFLASHPGLEGLAEAGRRYKAALDARPADPVALRWRDEVIRRATALALAQLPRSAATVETWRRRRRLFLYAALFLLVAGVVAAAAGARP